MFAADLVSLNKKAIEQREDKIQAHTKLEQQIFARTQIEHILTSESENINNSKSYKTQNALSM